MKALITAGGKGTRLRPITHTRNKHLIPIANKPILHYAVEYVAQAGIRDVGIIVNADNDDVQREMGDGSCWGLRFRYIPQESPLGLAHCIKISQDFIGKDQFVFYLGDNMVVGGIKRYQDEFIARKSNCHLTLARVKDPERFGVPEIKGDSIVRVVEKPKTPASQYAVSGIYFYDSTIFEAVNAIKPSARGELEISDAHQHLLDHGRKVTFSEITGWWKDTGLPDDLLEANRLVLDHIEPGDSKQAAVDDDSNIAGKVTLMPGSRVINSNIRGPAVIGARTVIENSYVGPYTAIGEDCLVRNSEVEFSIVLNHVAIRDIGIRIEGSLLGCDSVLDRARSKPRTHRFVLGDQGTVEIA